MTTPFAPQPPRTLERSRSNRLVAGVCGGVATYLNMDPTLVRVLTVVISLFTGVPVLLYLVAMFLMPEEAAGPVAAPPTYAPSPSAGPAPQAPGEPNLWGPAGAPWEQPPSAAPATGPGESPAAEASDPTDGPSAPDQPDHR